LPEAKAIFEKKPKVVPSIIETWEAARVILVEGMGMAVAQMEVAQQMAPEILLQRIEGRMARLEDAFESISAAVLMKGKSNEVLEKVLEAAARKQRAVEALVGPALAEGGKVAERSAEEVVVEEVVHATSDGLLGIGEEAAQSVAANASRSPNDDKDD
jgi:hypothetical protein